MKRIRPVGVLVTGAAPGIGAECLESLRAEGRQVTDLDAKDRSAADDHNVRDLSSETCGDNVLRSVSDHDVEVFVSSAVIAEYSAALDSAPRAG